MNNKNELLSSEKKSHWIRCIENYRQIVICCWMNWMLWLGRIVCVRRPCKCVIWEMKNEMRIARFIDTANRYKQQPIKYNKLVFPDLWRAFIYFFDACEEHLLCIISFLLLLSIKSSVLTGNVIPFLLFTNIVEWMLNYYLVADVYEKCIWFGFIAQWQVIFG